MLNKSYSTHAVWKLVISYGELTLVCIHAVQNDLKYMKNLLDEDDVLNLISVS